MFCSGSRSLLTKVPQGAGQLVGTLGLVDVEQLRRGRKPEGVCKTSLAQGCGLKEPTELFDHLSCSFLTPLRDACALLYACNYSHRKVLRPRRGAGGPIPGLFRAQLLVCSGFSFRSFRFPDWNTSHKSHSAWGWPQQGLVRHIDSIVR